MRSFFKNLTILLFFVFFIPQISFADFQETSPNVFQYSNKEYKIIITQYGIFVAQTKKIDNNKFNKKNLTNKEVIRHCFIKYDAQKNIYDTLMIGENNYYIQGALNIFFGDMVIKIDGLNTYATFVVNDKEINESEQGILGILGTTPVTNTTGSSFVAFLEANAISKQDEEVIKDYTISKDDELYEKDKLVEEGSDIGKKFRMDKSINECLQEDALILSSNEIRKLERISKDKKTNAQELEKIYSENKSSDILKDYLIMRVESTAIILLDYVGANIKIVKKLGKSKNTNKTLCVIKNIEI